MLPGRAYLICEVFLRGAVFLREVVLSANDAVFLVYGNWFY